MLHNMAGAQVPCHQGVSLIRTAVMRGNIGTVKAVPGGCCIHNLSNYRIFLHHGFAD
jgi:cell division FtsZ-interacting protein ZapD